MNRKVRIIQIGYGKMGCRIVSYMIESGADIIGIFDADPLKNRKFYSRM